MRKTASVLGITGQGGSYLAEFLLDKGYTAHIIIRRSSSFNTARVDHIFDKIKLHYGDLGDCTKPNNVLGWEHVICVFCSPVIFQIIPFQGVGAWNVGVRFLPSLVLNCPHSVGYREEV